MLYSILRWLMPSLAIAVLMLFSWFNSPEALALASPQCPTGMTLIPGGTFRMGANDHYPDELAVEAVTVDSFCMDKYEITNAQFAQFVKETGYVTIAERPIPKDQYPDLTDEQRSPGSLVFEPPPEGTEINQVGYMSWWHWTPGASWQHPAGPNSNLEGKENYPVVHIAYKDAEAYAQWAKKSLPTEAQWEFAARGKLKNRVFGWGNTYSPKKANTWQGEFPVKNTQADGYVGPAPVGSFPPNGYGLYDTTGNVWEWTLDWYRPGHPGMAHQVNPVVAQAEQSFDPREPGVAKHVIKGGSYLCSRNYCTRYRPAAREALEPDTGMAHLGFRLVTNPTDTRTLN